jgi:hypothetical protein
VEEGSLATTVLDHNTVRLLIVIGVTTFGWIATTLLTAPESKTTLQSFYKLTHPGGPGWRKVIREAEKEGVEIDKEKGMAWEMPLQILCVFIGAAVIYAMLFSIGNFLYGRMILGIVFLVVVIAGTYLLFRFFSKLRTEKDFQ